MLYKDYRLTHPECCKYNNPESGNKQQSKFERMMMVGVRNSYKTATTDVTVDIHPEDKRGVLVFCLFNFRPKGKAKCFAGDVGSISIAFIMLFAIGRLVVQTQDVTYLIFLLVYGIDGCLTICHRILLHENLGEAHRKHAYQLMANELKIGHVKVSLLYMVLQLAVSLIFIYFVPDTVVAHWIYLVAVIIVFAAAYILFKKKYYHLHEEYLESLKESRSSRA